MSDREVRLEHDRVSLLIALRSAGLCPCQTDIEDPGPEHIPTCPNVDLDYVPETRAVPPAITVFVCDVCDQITGVNRTGDPDAPPPVCCGRLSDGLEYVARARGDE
jgi:hypothetical protein